jgi:hypothetical protein
MNKYLEKIAEQSYKQDSKEIATAGVTGGVIGGYAGKLQHEDRVGNLRRGGSFVDKRKMDFDTIYSRRKAGQKLAPLMDNAFKKQHIIAGAKKGAAIGLGASLVGHALFSKERDKE